MANIVLENFGGLVDMVLFSPQGEFIEHLSMNKDILQKKLKGAKQTARFKSFLQAGQKNPKTDS